MFIVWENNHKQADSGQEKEKGISYKYWQDSAINFERKRKERQQEKEL